jgi:hypothetical protein
VQNPFPNDDNRKRTILSAVAETFFVCLAPWKRVSFVILFLCQLLQLETSGPFLSHLQGFTLVHRLKIVSGSVNDVGQYGKFVSYARIELRFEGAPQTKTQDVDHGILNVNESLLLDVKLAMRPSDSIQLRDSISLGLVDRGAFNVKVDQTVFGDSNQYTRHFLRHTRCQILGQIRMRMGNVGKHAILELVPPKEGRPLFGSLSLSLQFSPAFAVPSKKFVPKFQQLLIDVVEVYFVRRYTCIFPRIMVKERLQTTHRIIDVVVVRNQCERIAEFEFFFKL